MKQNILLLVVQETKTVLSFGVGFLNKITAVKSML